MADGRPASEGDEVATLRFRPLHMRIHASFRPRKRDRIPRGCRPRRTQRRNPAGRRRTGALGREARGNELNRYERIWLGALRTLAAIALVSVVGLLASACGPDAATRVAGRVLEDYRKKASARPLPPAGSVRLRLSPAGEGAGEGGIAIIEWADSLYRETVTSAGVSTVRGIQAGKAFFTDEDGVTRVGSEPMLAELRTRSYFWRRAFLFEDRERANLSLGPTDEKAVSVRLRPLGGNELTLFFDRRTSALAGAVSPRFHLAFESPTRLRDLSRLPAIGEITWSGLPTRRLPDATVGGWHGRFSQPAAEAELIRTDGGISLPASISGVPARLAIDADEDGPLRISPQLAKKASLRGRRDVFGRVLAEGATLQIGTLSMPSLHVEIGDSGTPGIDAVAGGVLYRETVVEIDPSGGKARLHDPARWVPPEGFGRNVLDDDGNVPVALLFRSGRRLRLRVGVPDPSALVLSAEIASELEIDGPAPSLGGLVWGTLRLPPLPVHLAARRFDANWGDAGGIAFPLLLRFHVFVDMPHRWVYLSPAGKP